MPRRAVPAGSRTGSLTASTADRTVRLRISTRTIHAESATSTFSLALALALASGVSANCTPVRPAELAVENLSERNSCGSQPGAAGPVNVVQGNFWQTWTDLSVAGRGSGMTWGRTYSSSRASVDGPLGFGWTASYFMNLSEASGVVTITQENGATVEFRSFAGGWVAAPRWTRR